MRKTWILPAVSGLLFALAYPPYNLEFLVWIGFIPLLILLKTYNFKLKTLFISGLLAGFIFFAIVMKWLWAVYPLNWTGIESTAAGFFIIGLIWLISALGMALSWGLAIFTTGKINQLRKYTLLIIFPSVFVLTEYIRSWFFGLLWLGSGTLWGPHWTIGNLAYSLHNNPLFLKLSSFIGIYGITLIIALINILIFFILFSQKASYLKKIGAAILIILILSYLPKFTIADTNYEARDTIPLAVIQTKVPSDINYPIDKQLEDFKKQLSLLKETSKIYPQPKIIIFPEGANFFKNLSIFLDVKGVKEFFENNFKEPTLIVDNSRLPDEFGQIKSRVIYLDTRKGVLDIYDKQFLTPVGEFIPYHLKLLVNLFSKETLNNFSAVREFSKGTRPPQLIESNFKTGALVCSEIFTPQLFRKLSSQNPDFLIAMTSTGLFKGTEDLLKQDLAIVKFRAAENNKYLILSTNDGYSYTLTNTGKIQKISQNKDFQLFTDAVVPLKSRTWYNKLGDFPTLTLSLIITAFALITTKRREI